MVSLSKYYLIITMITATPEFGTDMFIFHQENDTQQQCLDRLDANPDDICGLQSKTLGVDYNQKVRIVSKVT